MLIFHWSIKWFNSLFQYIHFVFHLSIPLSDDCQEPFEDGLANGDEPSAAEEAAALAAKEGKGGTVKFGWVKGVLVSVSGREKLKQYSSMGCLIWCDDWNRWMLLIRKRIAFTFHLGIHAGPHKINHVCFCVCGRSAACWISGVWCSSSECPGLLDRLELVGTNKSSLTSEKCELSLLEGALCLGTNQSEWSFSQ